MGGKPLTMASESVSLEVVRAGSDAGAVSGVDPEVLAAPGLLRLRTASGRELVTRAEPAESERGAHTIQLSRDQLQYLKPRFREHVLATPIAEELASASRVVLECLFPVSANLSVLEQEIGRTWAMDSPVLQSGILCRVTVPGFNRPMPFRVSAVDPAPALVDEGTRILVRPSTLSAGQAANIASFGDVGGLDALLDELRELIEAPMRDPDLYDQMGIEQPRGILLWGPPGAGKTYLARAVTNEIGAHFLYVNGPEIVSGVQGGTEANLRHIFEEAMEHAPAIVLIDEMDAVAPARADGGSQADVRLSSQLLGLLDGLVQMERVMVIGTTNRPQAIDPALRRPGRLDREVYVGPPNEKGRLEILTIHTRRMPLEPATEAYLPEVARRTPGYVGADLVGVIRTAGVNAMRRVAGPGFRGLEAAAVPTVTRADFDAALETTRPSALRETLLRAPEASLSDLAGLDAEIAELNEAVIAPLLHPALADEIGLRAPKGVLISGPSGSGKSLLARAIAAELGANFIPVSGQELFSQWFGQSEAALRHVFNVATKVSPAVVVIDPIDAIAADRNEAVTSAQARVRDQLIAELDAMPPALPVLVVGVTQNPARLDPSLLQAERLGFHLQLTAPDETGREAILAHTVGPETWATDPDSWTKVAHDISTASEGWSGSELRALVDHARRRALTDALSADARGEGAPGLSVDHLWNAWLAEEKARRRASETRPGDARP